MATSKWASYFMILIMAVCSALAAASNGVDKPNEEATVFIGGRRTLGFGDRFRPAQGIVDLKDHGLSEEYRYGKTNYKKAGRMLGGGGRGAAFENNCPPAQGIVDPKDRELSEEYRHGKTNHKKAERMLGGGGRGWNNCPSDRGNGSDVGSGGSEPDV